MNLGEQQTLNRLSVFAGSFDLESAEAVASDAVNASPDVLDQLAALVDKSLVEADRTAAPRYRLLESIRQYANAKLITDGGNDADAARAAHRDHYLALAETAAPHLIGHGNCSLRTPA